MSRLLCLLLISYVLSDEITFNVRQSSTPAYNGDCSQQFVCKNDKPTYYLADNENELTVFLYSGLKLKYANCILVASDKSTVQITTPNFIMNESIINSQSYTMTLNLKDTKHGYLKCNFTNVKEETECDSDHFETNDLLAPTCVANIIKPYDEDQDPEEKPLPPVHGYTCAMGVIPNDDTEANKTLIEIEDKFLFSIKCYENCKGQKFLQGKFTWDEDTSNSTSTSYKIVDVTEIGSDTYEARFNRSRTQYSCKEKNKKPRTFKLVNMKSKVHDPIASPLYFITGVVGITLLVTVGLMLLYKRWKIVSKESKAKIKKSSTQTDNFNQNRVSYVELDFDQNVNSDFVPAETTQYATVIGVMAPREPDHNIAED